MSTIPAPANANRSPAETIIDANQEVAVTFLGMLKVAGDPPVGSDAYVTALADTIERCKGSDETNRPPV